ncbi:MAG: response regulator transcription factor [Armatimonadetes bacterium]|nr:response regulator transcription factor [Armatimonadota bacterium]
MSEIIQALIVDDEPLARRNLKGLLKGKTDIHVVAECRNGAEAIAQLKAHPVDLVFLDIQMPEMDGFQAVAEMPRPLPVIIFVTAYDQFALQAFDVNALDYLLKPIDQERFEVALARAREQLKAKDFRTLEAKIDAVLAMRSQATEPESEFLKRISVPSGSRLILIDVDEIDFIEANDYYAAIHVGAKSHLVRQSMKELEARLDPAVFVRIHRSAIVNISRVTEFRKSPSSGHSVVLRSGQTLKLSRSRWDEVRARLTK